MKKYLSSFSGIISVFFIAFSSLCFAHEPASSAAQQNLARPKLVVGIVVDQMRWDYLYRFYDRYHDNGFRRMFNQGFSAENTSIDYVPTITALGHTCVYTGSVPAIHGIAGNNFIIQKTGESVYCTEDNDVKTVGSDTKAGLMSPKNLLTSTITDELKIATNFRAKVIGVALKDRGSILPAGHAADAAYWFDGKTGDWITSTWYMEELPAWVKKVNGQGLVEKYLNQGWNTLYPIETYVQSSEDNNAFEGKFKGTEAPVFPIDTKKLYQESGPGIIRSTPYGNSLTLEMAKAAVENEQLGGHDVTDFLAISLSSTDYVGHQFGPNAIETEDTYLRLDQDLGDFFDYLDKTVGKGEYTVFLSADHGGANNIEFLKHHKLSAGAWDMKSVQKALNDHLQSIFGSNELVLSLLNYQVHFNEKEIGDRELNMDKVKKESISFLEGQTGIAYVVDMENAVNASIPGVIRERIVNGYHHERSGTVQIILQPAWYSSGSAHPTGTSHAAWNPYDSHIPLLFMGWGVRQGKTSRPTHMTDIAATVAALLKIQQPNGCIGSPITEVLKNE